MDANAPARPHARWYLVQAKTGREAFAQAQLRRQGFQTFLPLSLRTVRHGRKIETRQSAYFPGYLFVEFDPGADRWRPINGTLGVVRLVSPDDRPAPAPRGLVETLRDRAQDAGLLDLSLDMSVGDSVALIDGPFAGQLGVIEQLKGVDRVRVLLDLMNRETRVEVVRAAIAPS